MLRETRSTAARLTDFVLEKARLKRRTLSKDERQVAAFLRGNEDLFSGLKAIIRSRIEGRASLPVPSTPQECVISMARDRELRWLLSRLEAVYHSPINEPADSASEQPG